MSSPHEIVWTNCLSYIKTQVTSQSYKTWFEPIKAVDLVGDVLTIQVPNKFFYEWLEEHFVGLLKIAITQELGDKAKLEYQVLLQKGKEKPTASQKTNHSKDSNDLRTEQGESIKNPFIIPGLKKINIDSQLNVKYTFNNFIEGDCNRMARNAGIAIANNPGGTTFNPFVVHGKVGLGKTHLAHAIGNKVRELFPEKTILYVTSDKFTNQFVESLKNNEVNDFVNFYQLIDVLIVDDIQFFENRLKTQEVFFHLFNQLHQSGKQIILTSDRAPKDMDNVEERLISRFKWGLTADLQMPDLETRMAIASNKLENDGKKVSLEVLEYISYNIQNNIRELEGVLISLLARASLGRKEIDIELAKTVIKDFITDVSKEISIDYIQDLVAERYNLNLDALQGKSRKRSIVIARQLCMYLSKNLTRQSLKTIGERFGGRDHSTVIYSCKAIQDLLDTDESFRRTVAEIEKKVKMTTEA